MNARKILLAAVVGAMLVAPRVLLGGTFTYDFRQGVDPARVSVGLNAHMATAVTGDGLRVWNTTGGPTSGIPNNYINLNLAGLVNSPVPSQPNGLFGDFAATLTYSGMRNWANSPSDGQRNDFRMHTAWGTLGGENYNIGRRYYYNWVVAGGYGPNNVTLAGRSISPQFGEWVVDNWTDPGPSGTFTIQRVGNVVSFYANGTLIGGGPHTATIGLRDFTFYVSQSGNQALGIEVTLNSFTLTGPNVISPVLAGDINRDSYVNVGDLQALVAAWASQAGPPPSPTWNADADCNSDDYVNVGDLQILVANWGQHL